MTLITAAALRDLLAGTTDTDAPVAVLDVRWTLAHPDGRDAFAAGHIPGAAYVDLDSQLSDHSRTGLGRHPLPTGPALQESLRALGVSDGDTVVVYDDAQAAGSSRAWWTLTAAGLNDVRILDGGWAAWRADGGEIETGTGRTPTPGDVSVPHDDLYAGARRVLTKGQAAYTGEHGVLLDARAPERYRGETEPVDPVAGHIPGAANLPSTSVLDEGGRFLPPDELRGVFAGLGVRPTTAGDPVSGAYCGSGVSAAVLVAAADSVGIDLALFPGSWSQWSQNLLDNPGSTTGLS
ncbi:sulfurtransferase [uncultured Corynebacterium sp.]|uniref:sulfurtransferase n=1 Tax=uncultured Corynebacterium sp. TaxID=159447 RepID=UPI0025CBAFB4|nr:sulfurtransferase [uncultured Corynebacterium sp.]